MNNILDYKFDTNICNFPWTIAHMTFGEVISRGWIVTPKEAWLVATYIGMHEEGRELRLAKFYEAMCAIIAE